MLPSPRDHGRSNPAAVDQRDLREGYIQCAWQHCTCRQSVRRSQVFLKSSCTHLPLTHSFNHPLTHLTHSLTHSLTHALAHSLTHSPTHSRATRHISFTRSLTRLACMALVARHVEESQASECQVQSQSTGCIDWPWRDWGIQLISSGVFLCPWKGAEPWRVPAHGMGRGACRSGRRCWDDPAGRRGGLARGRNARPWYEFPALKSQVCEIACCVNDCFRV